VIDEGDVSDSEGFVLAGVLAGGIGVSECFQHKMGKPVAGRRSTGISLWRPDLDWRDPESAGPVPSVLPSRAWLLGLGHLGQAYSWALGWLPYADRSQVTIFLQDTDSIVAANRSTGLLMLDDTPDETRKTRLVAGRLEALGMTTAICERRFLDSSNRDVTEPGLALGGFDDPAPRRALGQARFDRVIDGGLGPGPITCLDILVHSFPSNLDPVAAFAGSSTKKATVLRPAYEDEIRRRVAEGQSESEARCGVIEVAQRSVAVAFVGACAGAMVLAEAVRGLCGGPIYEVVNLDLRNPSRLRAAPILDPKPLRNTGTTPSRY